MKELQVDQENGAPPRVLCDPFAVRQLLLNLMLNALDQTGDRQAALARFVRSVSGAEARALRRALEALDRPDRLNPPDRLDRPDRLDGRGPASAGDSLEDAAEG